MMSYLTGPMLGSAKMGIVAEKFGVKSALVSGGVLCVCRLSVPAFFLPKFLKYDGREGVKQRDREEAGSSGIVESFGRRVLKVIFDLRFSICDLASAGRLRRRVNRAELRDRKSQIKNRKSQ
jgi:hypothetical protein